MHDGGAARTNPRCPAPQSLGENLPIGSDFDIHRRHHESGQARRTYSAVSKICTVSFARQLRRQFRAAYPERVLADRKAITFHLRRI
jgi:hypothetical protein